MGERSRQPALNAVRAFEAAARLGSLKAAAADLGVTASAVSHQVRQLEDEIGKRLFVRRNNGIELTQAGIRFFEQVGPALRMIGRAAETVRRDIKVVATNVSTTLAQRWLIPRLYDFYQRHPRIIIDMHTARRPIVLDESYDMTVSFHRDVPATPGAVELVSDFAEPMAAPQLARGATDPQRILETPLISSTMDSWEWHEWAEKNDVDFARLRIVCRFDSDAAAIAACCAGVGVLLLPRYMAQMEIESGQLVPFGRYGERKYGAYWLASAPRLRAAARTFRSWLLTVAPGVTPYWKRADPPRINGKGRKPAGAPIAKISNWGS